MGRWRVPVMREYIMRQFGAVIVEGDDIITPRQAQHEVMTWDQDEITDARLDLFDSAVDTGKSKPWEIRGTATPLPVLDANEESCRGCGEPVSMGGDGWNGFCPDCADRYQQEHEHDPQ